MKHITFNKVKKAFAKKGILFNLIISDSPMPYHLEVSLVAHPVLGGVPNPDVIEVLPYKVHRITSPTVHTHPNVLAERLWNVLKKHPLQVNTVGKDTIYYSVNKKGNLRQLKNQWYKKPGLSSRAFCIDWFAYDIFGLTNFCSYILWSFMFLVSLNFFQCNG